MTGLAIINGIPTVIGGISATEFLGSVEQLDNSRDEQAPKGREWRLVSQVNSFCRFFGFCRKVRKVNGPLF